MQRHDIIQGLYERRVQADEKIKSAERILLKAQSSLPKGMEVPPALMREYSGMDELDAALANEQKLSDLINDYNKNVSAIDELEAAHQFNATVTPSLIEEKIAEYEVALKGAEAELKRETTIKEKIEDHNQFLIEDSERERKAMIAENERKIKANKVIKKVRVVLFLSVIGLLANEVFKVLGEVQ